MKANIKNELENKKSVEKNLNIVEESFQEFGDIDSDITALKNRPENFICTEIGCCTLITATTKF